MDIGVCIAAKIDDVGVVPFAENLGYSHAWVADSQMIWSDCYAFLALAAERTRSIKIGGGWHTKRASHRAQYRHHQSPGAGQNIPRPG